MGSLRVGHDWATSLSLFTFMHWRRKWQPTPVFLPGESQGQRSWVGCLIWGCTESTRLKRLSSSLGNPDGRRSLVGYSPWGCEESDTTERLNFHISFSCTGEGNGNPLQYSCLENPREGSLVGCRLWGCAELDTTGVTYQQQQLQSYIIKIVHNLSI